MTGKWCAKCQSQVSDRHTHWGTADYVQSPIIGSPWQCAKCLAVLKSNNVKCKCRKVNP